MAVAAVTSVATVSGDGTDDGAGGTMGDGVGGAGAGGGSGSAAMQHMRFPSSATIWASTCRQVSTLTILFCDPLRGFVCWLYLVPATQRSVPSDGNCVWWDGECAWRMPPSLVQFPS